VVTDPKAKPGKDACPHCGKPVGLSWSELLPSRDNNRVLTCKACGGHFDLSNGTKMAAVASGMLGMAFAMFGPFQWIVRAGNGSKSSIIYGLVAAVVVIGLTVTTTSRLTMQLERKR
jgi:hypothetical protein